MQLKNIAKKLISYILLICISFSLIIAPVAAEAREIKRGANHSADRQKNNENKINKENGAKIDLKNSRIKNKDAITDRYIIKYKPGKREKGKEKLESSLKTQLKAAKLVNKKNDKAAKQNIERFKNNKKAEKQKKNHDVIITDKKIKLKDLASLLAIENNEDIEYIQPDYKLKLGANDTYLNEKWALHNTFNYKNPEETVTDSVYNDIEIWNKTQGEGIIVAVIDTGIDTDHEDLMANIWSNEKEIPDNGIDDDGNGYTDDTKGWNFHADINIVKPQATDEIHGTHIAGIIAAEKDNGKGIAGVAPKAKIMTLKAFDGNTAYTSDIIEAIEYAKEMGADIVNCSWGGADENPALKEAIEQSGLLFIVAAGNSSRNIDIEPTYPASYDSENILTAASINKNNKPSSTSNFGQASVDLSAPGENILSTYPHNTYGYLSGTSISAAFTSGAGALIKSLNKEFIALDIKNEIINTTIDADGLKIVNIDKSILMTENDEVTVVDDVYGTGDIDLGIDGDLDIITDIEDEYTLVTEEVYGEMTVIEDIYMSNFSNIDVLSLIRKVHSINSFDKLPDEEKNKICYLMKVKQEDVLMFEKYGYKVYDSIRLSQIAFQYSLEIEEVQKLMQIYKDYYLIENDLSRLITFITKNSLKHDEDKVVRQMFLKGYKLADIESTYGISVALGVGFLDIIRKKEINEESIESILKNNKLDYSAEEIELFKALLRKYYIDFYYLINYINSTGTNILIINDLIQNHMNAIQALKTVSLQSSDNIPREDFEDTKIINVPFPQADYSKSLSAPFEYRRNHSEKVSLSNGSLSFETKLINLPGRNSLDLDISLKYSSQKSNLKNMKTEMRTYYKIIQQGYGFTVELDNNDNEIWYTYSKYNRDAKFYGTYSNFDDAVSDSKNKQYMITHNEYINIEGNRAYDITLYEAKVYAYNEFKNILSDKKEKESFGTGWKLNLPSIEIDDDKYLKLGTGEKYKIDFTSNPEDSNLEEYLLKDIKIEYDSSYNLSGKNSTYVLKHKSGKKKYFDYEGKLMGIKDRNNNQIKFLYDSSDRLNQIIDTLNRKINFTYNSGQVIIGLPDNNNIQLNLESISGHRGKYFLKSIRDQKQRETTFEYSIDSSKFNFYTKGLNFTTREEEVNKNTFKKYIMGTNYFANLNTVTYPTQSVTSYDYDKTTGNLGKSGLQELYRINSRKDLQNNQEYNLTEYLYGDNNSYPYKEESNNFTGYPREDDPNNSFKYETVVKTQAGSGQTLFNIYKFNDDSLKEKQRTIIQASGTDTKLKEITTTYDSYKLIDKEVSTIYGYNGDNLTSGASLTVNKDWNYNDYGDLLQYTNEEGHITKYQYEANFHQVTLEEQQIAPGRWKKTKYDINQATGNINWMKQHNFENGVDKSIITKYPSYDSYGNVLVKRIEEPDGTLIMQENYSYGPDEEGTNYNNAYLTKKSIKVSDYSGNSETIEEKYTYYFDTGLIKTYKDGRGNRTTHEYDALGRKIKEINADASHKEINYDDTNNIVSLTIENGHKIREIYDGLGRLKTKQELKEGTTNIWITLQENQYNSLGQLEWTKDNKGIQLHKKTSYEYDALGRTTKVINPDLTFTETKYYDVQNKRVEIDEEKKEHISIYDNVGNLKKERVKPDSTKPTEYITTYNYDYLGNLTYVKNPEKHEVNYKFDDLGRLKEVENPKKEKTSYEYDGLGSLKTIIMQEYNDLGQLSKEIITEKEYDELGRPIKSYAPYDKTKGRDETKVTKIAYNQVGKIDHKIDKEGQRIECTYDNLNRILTQTAKKKNGEIYSQTTYNYDNLYTQNIMTIADSRGTITYEYYSNGKLKKESLPNDANKNTQYEYYDDGNLRYITDPFNLKVEYTYDDRNRIDLIKVDGKTFNYDYHDDGMIKTLQYPNANTKTEFTYYDTNQLSTIKNTIGGEIDDYSYTYDGNGNVTTITEMGISTSYAYDKLSRLDIITRPGNKIIDFKYDARGNRKEIQANDYGQIDYLHRLKPGEYRYNPLGQLTEYITKGNTYKYKYDNRGLRVEKITPEKTIKYHYNQSSKVIAESDQNGSVTAQIIWGHKPLARKVNGKYYFYMYNGHGDVVKLVDESGTIVNRYKYDEWGNILEKQEEIDNPIRYTGEYFDEESGNYYLRARYYDPLLGRFISKDSYEGEVTNPLSMNQYIYCLNNPLKYEDPSGNFGILTTIALGMAAGALFDIGKQVFFEDRSFSNIDSGSAFKSALIGGIGGGVAFGVGAVGTAIMGATKAAGIGFGISTSMISGSITNVIGDSLIYNRVDDFEDFMASATIGAVGGVFGYISSYAGGKMAQKLGFNRMTRSAQRRFMRANFGIKSNISNNISLYSQNNNIANYYQNTSWIIGGTSNLFSNYGVDLGKSYLPSYFNNSFDYYQSTVYESVYSQKY